MNEFKGRRKSSNSSKRRRSSSKRKSISNTSKQELKSLPENTSQKSTLIPEIEKPRINYQDELVLIFFNSMLDVIVQEWTPILDEPAPLCKCFKHSNDKNTISKNFKELVCQDVEGMELTDVQGSIVSLTKKRSSTEYENKKQVQEPDLYKLQGIEENSIISEKSKLLQPNNVSGTTLVLSHSSACLLNPPDEQVIIKFKNGNCYEGSVSKLKMHGIGKFKWSDGAVYEGEFVYGDATGNGALVYTDLTYYYGEFQKNLLHGKGVINISSTPIIYSGHWKAGKKHGQGWLLYESGNWYEGEWFEDNRQGIGLRQYKTGEKYKGNWYQGKRHGQGTCIWSNNDFYKGEWMNGTMHGYGEYTWNAFSNKTFTFPDENIYYGTWSNGMKDGVAILNFGTKTGTKLAGVWQHDQKHGPGVIVCSNGKIIERNPLFWCDKPVHLEPEEANHEDEQNTISSESIMQRSESQRRTKSTLQLISEQVHSKRLSNKLESDALQNFLNSQEKFKRSNNVIKSRPKFLAGKIQCNPLHIPLHSSPCKIDLTHYITLAVQKYTERLYKADILNVEESNASGIKTEIHTSIASKYSKWNVLFHNEEYGDINPASFVEKITLSTSEYDSRLSTFKLMQANIEEKYLSNAITNHLKRLYSIYDKYATIASPSVLKFKPILIRLFLWQMLKDIGVAGAHAQYSLIDMDIILIESPASGLESDHYPFERIYFWQFLQILLTLAWLLHSESDVSNNCKQTGILATIFENFLKESVYKNPSITSGCSIFEYRDLLPINSIYLLYKSLGEPHTVRAFLNNVCPKKGEEPPCYLKVFPDNETPKLIKGSNVVVGGNAIFLPENSIEIGVQPKDSLPEPPYTDPFRMELFALRSIGPKKVVQCLKKACPQIDVDGLIVNMEYPLSFIEFYDALLTCTFMVVDRVKRREERIRLHEENKRIQELLGSEIQSVASTTGKSIKDKKKMKPK